MTFNAKNLLDGAWKKLEFEPFRDGVTIHWLRHQSPQVAILKYEPGASVPKHRHLGLETILVLSGEQTDDNGTIRDGDFTINEPATEHSVHSKTGCAVLIQWEKPVEFI